MNEREIIFQKYTILSGEGIIISYFFLVLYGLWQIKNIKMPLRIFFYYILATLLINLLEHGFIWGTRLSTYYHVFKPFLEYWQISNTFFLNILYYLKNTIFLGWFFIELIPPISKQLKILVFFTIIFEIIIYLFVDGYQNYGNVNPPFDALFCFALPFLYLWYLYRSPFLTRITLYKNSFFWISLGLIMENLTGILYFFVADKVYDTDFILYSTLSIGKNVVLFIAIILFALAFYNTNLAKFLSSKEEK